MKLPFFKHRKITTITYAPGSRGEWGLQDFQAEVNEMTVPLGKAWGGWIDDGNTCHNDRMELWNHVKVPDHVELRVDVSDALVTLYSNGRAIMECLPLVDTLNRCVKKAGWLRFTLRMCRIPWDKWGNDTHWHCFWCHNPAEVLLSGLGDAAWTSLKDFNVGKLQ